MVKKKPRKRVYLYYQGETIRKNREEKQNPWVNCFPFVQNASFWWIQMDLSVVLQGFGQFRAHLYETENWYIRPNSAQIWTRFVVFSLIGLRVNRVGWLGFGPYKKMAQFFLKFFVLKLLFILLCQIWNGLSLKLSYKILIMSNFYKLIF
jgi:hypothetical protein